MTFSLLLLVYGVSVPCYIYALVVYFAEFSRSLVLNIMLLVAYGRYFYAKYVFDVTRRITINGVNISAVCAVLVTIRHAGIPNISFIIKNKKFLHARSPFLYNKDGCC